MARILREVVSTSSNRLAARSESFWARSLSMTSFGLWPSWHPPTIDRRLAIAAAVTKRTKDRDLISVVSSIHRTGVQAHRWLVGMGFHIRYGMFA
ncbi:hypothetical protein AL072_24415 [Azospirillum thiophilum]|uniref:Uncharacterized protein n=1 Tax=Azospirillum thiophilum TaxID=528244 RepID=A0AAC8W3A9_9PROT|nr:hypothetical protein AL072_24415 [Azospirillum thiophilum]